MSIDQDWEDFLNCDDDNIRECYNETNNDNIIITDCEGEDKELLERNCEELYISTQTKIYFLNKFDINVNEIFWNIPIIPYTTPQNGVIKKQIRLVFEYQRMDHLTPLLLIRQVGRSYILK